MRRGLSEVQNTSTRRVDWVIRPAGKRIRAPLNKGDGRVNLHTSWFSPTFDAAGVHGLQLELQVFRVMDPPLEGEEMGNCAVFLWACRGTNLVYRLSIGNRAQTIEKKFNGRVPFGTNRLCFFADHINPEDDSLTVGVEILESVRQIEQPLAPPPLPDGSEGPAGTDTGTELALPPEGALLYHRHVNNRLYEQVKNQVEIMKSRLVRAVEWRIEQASLLRRCFPSGEAMCSKEFHAASLEGLQLVFYPSGYAGATEGFCSIFLFAPAGAMMSCTLTAGKERREATHAYEQNGAYGRTNFCRLEACIDESDDTILIGLEIEEAHQDVVATVAHTPAFAGDRRGLSAIEGAATVPITSAVKLQRVAGRVAAELQDVKLLPSLWAPRRLDETGLRTDGFKSFKELRGRVRRPPTASGHNESALARTAPRAAPSSAGMSRPGSRGPELPASRPSSRGPGSSLMAPGLGFMIASGSVAHVGSDMKHSESSPAFSSEVSKHLPAPPLSVRGSLDSRPMSAAGRTKERWGQRGV